MTANQIIIPIIAFGVAATFVTLKIRAIREARRAPKQTHKAHSPDRGEDEGAKLYSKSTGMAGMDR